jgi:autotransporter-associated beta strand protein
MKTNKPNGGIIRAFKLPALLMALSAMAGLTASAASITFNTNTIASDTDVKATGGGQLAAFTWGTAATVNGVSFAASTATAGVNSFLVLSSFTGRNATAFGVGPAPYTNLSSAYQSLIQGAVFGATNSSGTVTLTNLTVNSTYFVQLWMNDSRLASSNRVENIYSGSGPVNTLIYNSTQTNGGVGEYAYATFVADAPTQVITLDGVTPNNPPSAAGALQLNAIQLRDITAVWSGAASTNWNSTDLNFSGASYSTVSAATTNVYFGDLDASGFPVVSSNVFVQAGGVTGANVNFNNHAVMYTFSSADANGISGAFGVNLSGTNLVTFNGANTYSGSTVLGANAQLNINAAQSYTGNTILGTGAKLALGASGSIANSANLNLGANSIFTSAGAGAINATAVTLGTSSSLTLGPGGAFNAASVNLGTSSTLTLGAGGTINNATNVTLGANSTLTLGSSGPLTTATLIDMTAGSTLDATAASISLPSGGTLRGGAGLTMVKGDVTAAAGSSIILGAINGSNSVATLIFSNNLSLNAQSFLFDIGVNSSAPADQVNIAGALNMNGDCSVTLNKLSQVQINGTYTLITYGSKSGSGNFVLSTTYPGITLNNNANSVTLTVTGGLTGTDMVWTNLIGGNWTTAANWQGGIIATGIDNIADFSTLNISPSRVITNSTTNITIGNMLFGDTTPDSNWTLQGGTNTLAVSSGSPLIYINNQTTSISSSLRGTQGFTKNGAGSLTLSPSAGTSNVLSGAINVNAGTMNMNAPNFLNGSVNVNAGALNLSGVNSFGSSPITINGGTATVLGATATTGGATVNGGLLSLSAANTIIGGITVNAGASLTASVQGSFGGTTNPTVNPITLSNASMTLSAALANNAWMNNLIFQGASNAIICGANTPGFRGATGSDVVSGNGTVTFNCSAAQTPALAGHMTGFSGTLIVNGSLGFSGLLFGHNQDTTGTPPFYPGADGITGSSNAVFAFTNSDVIYVYNGAMPGTNYMGELRGDANSVLWAKNGRSGDVTLEVGGLNTTSTFSGGTRDNRSAATTTHLGIRKVGTGTLTLAGTCTNTGPTDIRGGTLAVSGSLGVTPVTVSSGAAFQLTGSIGSPTVTVNNGGSFVLASPANLNSTAITLNGLMDVSSYGSTFNLGSATLTGSGLVTGTVGVTIGATINPGSVGTAGTLTVTNGDLTIFGGNLNFDLSNDPINGVNDLIVVNGNLNLNAAANLNINKITGTLGAGTYKLIAFSGAFNGSLNNLTLVGAGPLDVLQQNGQEIDLVVAPGVTLVWTGGQAGNLWDITNSVNWVTNNTFPTTFTNGEAVVFRGINASNPVVNISQTVLPDSVTVQGASNFTFTGSADIGNGASLTKNGAGSLTILNTNTYAGGTFINAGILKLGDGTANNGVIVGNIADAASLIVANPMDQTLANVISGAGTVTKQGTGTLTLTGNSTLTGITTISAGTLSLGNGGGTGSLGTGNVTNNAMLVINHNNAISVSNNVAGTGLVVNQGNGSVTLAGAIGGSCVLSNAVGTGSGTLYVANSNSFSGGTYIDDGKVMLQNFYGFGSGPVVFGASSTGSLHFAPALSVTNTVANSVALPTFASQQQFMMDGTSLGVRTTVRLTGVISGGQANTQTIFVDSGVGGNTRGVLLLDNPANTFTATPDVYRGTLAFTSDGALGDPANTIRVDSANHWTAPFDQTQQGLRFDADNIVLNASRNIQLVGTEYVDVQGFTGAIAGNITGQVGMNKQGAGTLILGGSNSIAGTINLNAGTMVVNGYTFAGLIAVNSGTTLNAYDSSLVNPNGTLEGDVSLNGTLSLGTPGIGTLTMFTNHILSFNSTSTNIMKVNAALGTSDIVTNMNYVTYAGTLVLNNLAGNFVPGQQFKLFGPFSTNSSGTFSTIVPATPGNGMVWNFNRTNGVLSVNASVVTSTNAYLTSLVITPAGTLNPAFTTNNFNYTATNAYVNNPVTVTATAADAGATLQLNFNGGGYGPLTNGVASSAKTLILPNNTIAVRVTAADNATIQTYNVNVTLQPSLTPAKLTNSVSGSTLTLSWPADHLGWHLQAQTNTLGAGLKSNAWVVVSGSDQMTSTNISITKTNPTVFYRITYP